MTLRPPSFHRLPAHEVPEQPQMKEHEFKDNPSAHGGYTLRQQQMKEMRDAASKTPEQPAE